MEEKTPMLDPRMANAHILIVDDQPANVQLVERLLQAQGFRNLTSTTDPREVAELYVDGHFDLILLDLAMPYMDGFEVMARLQPLAKDDYLPILVLTANADQETRLRALAAGAKDFLGKPFDLVEMQLRIRNMLEIRMLHNQVRNQNEILEQRVSERTRELNDTRLEVIRRLGRAAEFRDNETGNHIIRMSKFTQLIAHAAGVNAKESELLLTASPMHDVGKIGIPDHILLKPGKLTPEEFDIMKSHTLIGGELLSGHESDLMVAARTIAMTHHEKWDGSGYPNGLKEEEIPLSGRIVALADVFDALTSVRPYKKAWSVEEALAYIEDQAGRHFDPSLAHLPRKLLGEIEAVRMCHVDSEETAGNAAS